MTCEMSHWSISPNIWWTTTRTTGTGCRRGCLRLQLANIARGTGEKSGARALIFDMLFAHLCELRAYTWAARDAALQKAAADLQRRKAHKEFERLAAARNASSALRVVNSAPVEVCLILIVIASFLAVYVGGKAYQRSYVAQLAVRCRCPLFFRWSYCSE